MEGVDLLEEGRPSAAERVLEDDVEHLGHDEDDHEHEARSIVSLPYRPREHDECDGDRGEGRAHEREAAHRDVHHGTVQTVDGEGHVAVERARRALDDLARDPRETEHRRERHAEGNDGPEGCGERVLTLGSREAALLGATMTPHDEQGDDERGDEHEHEPNWTDPAVPEVSGPEYAVCASDRHGP